MVVMDFFWVKVDVWVGYVVEKGGKFYWYVLMKYGMVLGFLIGVVVVDNLFGLFKDVCGLVIIMNDMMMDVLISWDDIDLVVFIDDDG